MRYTFTKKDDFFVREDKETSVIIIRQTAEQFLLNQTGLKIFKYLINNNDTDLVLEMMLKEYVDADKEIVNKDILAIINLLKIYNIIEVEEPNEHKKDKISAIDEDRYEEVGNFIEKNRNQKFLISGFKGYYVPQNIRTHIMSNKEYYYGIIEDDKYKCIAVINPNLNDTSVMNLSTLVFDEEMDSEDMVNMGKEIIKHMIKNMLYKVNKVRFSYYSKGNEEPQFLKNLKKIGFKKETTLKKEYRDFDMHMYAIYLE